MEIWKIIEGKPNYEISTHGRLRNIKTGYIQKRTKPNGSGYMLTSFYDPYTKKKTCKGIHWLVATTFIPNPDNLPTVDHLDKNTLNNHLDNLRWASWQTQWSNRDNKQGDKHPLSKLTEDTIKEILELNAKGIKQDPIAQRFEISQGLVSQVINGKRWKHLINLDSLL